MVRTRQQHFRNAKDYVKTAEEKRRGKMSCSFVPSVVIIQDTPLRFIALRSVTRAAAAAGGWRVRVFLLLAGESSARVGGGVDGGLGLGEVAFADGHAVEGAFLQVGAGGIRLRLRAEVVFHVNPRVARLAAQRATGVVATVDHAVLAARVARDAVHDARTGR